MKSSAASGALAGIVAALALAAPAVAGPTVTVRVEGEQATLLERTQVTLPDTGLDICGGTPNTVASALDVATGGDWDGQEFTSTILGETHTFANNDYWAQWLGRAGAYRFGTGICNDVMQEGDEALLLVDVSDANFNPTRFPLAVEGLPGSAVAGQSVPVTVVAYVTDGLSPAVRTPVAGAAIGGATTAADGRATVSFATPGTAVLKATKAGSVPSAAARVTVTAPKPGDPPPPPPPAKDTTAPTATFASLSDGKVFSRRKAPRELRGTVSEDPSGLRSVRLSILRRKGGKCWTYRDTTERFKRHRCGGKWYFRIGDRAEWSYLLPRKLPKGRYTIGVMAVDKAFNESRTTVEIRVK